MQRITKKQLEQLVDEINRLTNNPLTPYSQIDGKCVANPGNYHLEVAYGGWKLCQQCNGGGNKCISTQGYTTKRNLFHWLHAFIDGIEQGAKNA